MNIPTCYEHEQTILGCCLNDRACMAWAARMLTTEDFFDPTHAAVYAAMLAVFEVGKAVNYLTVKESAAWRGGTSNVDGTTREEYLETLAGWPSSLSAVEMYGPVLIKHRKLRGLMTLGQSMIADATTPGADPGEVVQRKLRELVGIETGAATESVTPLKEAVQEVFDSLDGDDAKIPKVVPFPWEKLNGFMTGGMGQAEVYVVGGDEGGGKSTFAYNAMLAAARGGLRVLLISYEVGSFRWGQIMLALGAGVATDDVQAHRGQGKKSDELIRQHLGNRTKFDAVKEFAHSTPDLHIDIAAGYPDLTELHSILTTAAVKGVPYGLMVIDHLHLMPTDRQFKRENGIEEQIRRNSNGVKSLAKKHNIPVLLLAQFVDKRNRATAPDVNDLKGSSAIKQDATGIILLWSSPDQRTGAAEGKTMAEIVIAVGKNRYGRSGISFTEKWNLLTRHIGEDRSDDWIRQRRD